MNHGPLLVKCRYRNHGVVWLKLDAIESIGEVGKGSVIRMTSGTIHDVLDTADEIFYNSQQHISA